MGSYKAFEENVEVNGQTVLSVVDGIGVFKDRAYDILKRHGIENIEPEKWYPQQSWLDAFKEIADSTGEFTLNSIGKKIPENAEFPPEIDDIEKALAAIDVAFHINHRINGKVMFNPETGEMLEGIGHYHFEKTGDNEARMVCDNAYPSDFDRGIIEAMARKFKPADSAFVSVRLDKTRPTRKEGADSCTFLVSW